MRRIAALLVDVVIVAAAVTVALRAVADAGVYVPRELSILVALPVYVVLCRALAGTTPGRALCARRDVRVGVVVIALAALAVACAIVTIDWARATFPAAVARAPLRVRVDPGREDPVAYAVAAASAHRVVLFGERHDVRENLQYLNAMIPALYERAGVTCVAMEACVAADDDDLLRLVTAPAFDGDLALRIARHHPWKTWGYREYWDVLHTAWAVNRDRDPGRPPLRVVGLDREWDLPSFALLGVGDDAVRGPWWEKLRLFRLLPSHLLVFRRDGIMARHVERAILDRGERGIAWVGAAHAARTGRSPRMGAMLASAHGDDVFAILLHGTITASAAIERLAPLQDGGPAAFDTASVPVSVRTPWTDGDVRLSDLSDGYVFLAPLASLHPCTWVRGYVSPAMFVRDEPFYEAVCGRRLASAADADAALAARQRVPAPTGGS